MQQRRPTAADWLVGGGELGALIRAKDWAATPLGAIDDWPQSLRSAVSILLPSKAQIVVFWGPELVAIYNDAYRPVFGSKHPTALGKPARQAWSEIWDVLEPLLGGVVNDGEAFWGKDLLFALSATATPRKRTSTFRTTRSATRPARSAESSASSARPPGA